MQIRGSALVVAGVLVATGWLLIGAAPQVAQQQVGPMTVAQRNAVTAIKPQDIVNIDSSNLVPNGLVSVPPADWLTVLTVPADRWFVMTNIQCDPQGSFRLEEVFGSVTTVKRGKVFVMNGIGNMNPAEGFASSVGLAFAPGSQVVLRNLDPIDERSINFTLTGYLASP